MNRSLQLKLAAAGVILLAVLVAIYFRLSEGIGPVTGDKRKDVNDAEKPLDRARNILRKDADLTSCRLALRHVSDHLTDPAVKQPPELPAARKEELRKQLGLNDAELEEVESRSFTALDGQYLELCLLLRDAARALETRPRSGPVAPEVEAAAAFAWVVRQVRLSTAAEREPAPQLVLRRGYGSPLARALLFLGLLEQLGRDGCLLALPGGSDAAPGYWACGVLGEKGQIYLFDPRLGIPLPGPGGKGIATLAQAQGKDSPLRQLDFGGEHHYDVKPEQAAEAEVHLAASLSALAPRMEFLEKELLRPAVKVRLAADPGAAGRFAQALKAGGHRKTDVKLAPWAARLLRDFVPKPEGGTDTTGRQDRAQATLAKPYIDSLHLVLPPRIRPRDAVDLQIPPLNQIYNTYYSHIKGFFLDAGQPRDLVLRGRYVEAQEALGLAHERAGEQKTRYENYFTGSDAPGPQAIEQWYAEVSRAAARAGPDAGPAIAEILRKYARPLDALLGGAGVDLRLAEIDYLQCLCQHEQAERLQFRLDHFPKEVTDQEVSRAEGHWKEMPSSWDRYLGRPGARGSARRFLARAQEKYGDVLALRAARVRSAESRPALEEAARQAWRQAVANWEDLAKQTQHLQGLAYRHHARRLQEKLDGKE